MTWKLRIRVKNAFFWAKYVLTKIQEKRKNQEKSAKFRRIVKKVIKLRGRVENQDKKVGDGEIVQRENDIQGVADKSGGFSSRWSTK